MSLLFPSLLIAAVFAVALLYSSVGHAGASGYIAVMVLAGFAPAEIKPVALFLNILVASLTAWQFWRAGHFKWRLFWPFGLVAVPAAFLGGYLRLPPAWFNGLIGVVLLVSALRFFLKPREAAEAIPPSRPIAIVAGGGLGLLAGLTGTGGGIFLTPLLLMKGWAQAKTAAAVSAVFILFNSVAGLLGHWQGAGQLPSIAVGMAVAAVFGGSVGSYLGSQRLGNERIKQLLAVVLLVAGAKLVFA